MGETSQTDHVSVDIPMLNKKLASSLKQKLCKKSPYLSENCIFKVPEKRRRNKNVFDPSIVSIGPYHCRKPELAPMKKTKSWYLQQLLHRLQLPPQQALELLVDKVRSLQSSARRCYAEPVTDLNDEEFIEMLVLDGCFLIELFRKDTWSIQPDEDDPIFNTSWMHENLFRDLILLENQIPWAVLLELLKLTEPAMPQDVQGHDVLARLVVRFFETMMLMTEPVEYRSTGSETRHILDLLRSCLLSLSADKSSESTNFELFPPVTDLLRVGVRFKKGLPGDIKCHVRRRVIRNPSHQDPRKLEALFRNLIAYEQCDGHCSQRFTYAVLLDCLINTSRDTDLLCEKRIVVHSLSTEGVSLIFNRVYNDTLITMFYYGGLTHKVNNYYGPQWRRWETTLKNKYFSNPWSISSFIAAILILVFTFTQTCSQFSLTKKPQNVLYESCISC